MNKWIAIPVIAVLVVATGVFGFLYMQKGGDLEDAQAEISSLESNVSGLQGQISTLNQEATQLNNTIATLQGNLTQTQNTLSQTQSALSQTQASYDLLSQSLALARPYAEIFEKYYFTTVFTEADAIAMDDAIGLLADFSIITAWNNFLFNPTDANFENFVILLWDKIWELLFLS